MDLTRLLDQLKSQFPEVQFIKLKQHKDSLIVFVGSGLEESVQARVREFLASITAQEVRFICNTLYTPISIGNVVLIGSGKGGVGKSTVTAQLAHRFAADGVRVGVIDADAYQPSIPLMLGVQGEVEVYASKDAKMIPIKVGNISLLSLGLWLSTSNAVVWSAAMGIELLRQFLHQSDWSGCDVILIDLPPGTGEMHSFIMQAIEVQFAVLVTTGQAVAQAGVRRFARMADVLGIPIAGYVLNMHHTECEFQSRLHEYQQLETVSWNAAIARACDSGVCCENDELQAVYQAIKSRLR